MIDELRLSVLFSGERFSPSEVEKVTGLELQNKIEIGEVPPKGRYKGKSSPIGSGLLKVPETVPYGNRLMWLVEILQSHLDTIYNLGAEPTQIYAGYFYKDQCNFGFTQEEILAVSKLDIELGISCYDTSEDEE